MKRILGLALLTLSLGSALSGCYVDERGCRGRWEREHRDAYGRWHRGRCW